MSLEWISKRYLSQFLKSETWKTFFWAAALKWRMSGRSMRFHAAELNRQTSIIYLGDVDETIDISHPHQGIDCRTNGWMDASYYDLRIGHPSRRVGPYGCSCWNETTAGGFAYQPSHLTGMYAHLFRPFNANQHDYLCSDWANSQA